MSINLKTAASILLWTLRGKTITRSMLNIRMSTLPPMIGTTIDLGGGGEPSYKGLIDIRGPFINMDATVEAQPTVVGNIEQTHPFSNDFADTIILLNTLEHIYNYNHVVSEMYRVLKKSGTSYVYVPFLFPVHVHQWDNFLVNDYFRYTRHSLFTMFTNAGFENIKIIPLGGLFLVIAEFIGFALKYRILRLTSLSLCLFCEQIFCMLSSASSAERYPLAYFVIAEK